VGHLPADCARGAVPAQPPRAAQVRAAALRAKGRRLRGPSQPALMAEPLYLLPQAAPFVCQVGILLLITVLPCLRAGT
jgi:hypothetical protein